MKVVIITTIILILFLVGAFYFNHYVDVETDKLLTTISSLDDAIMEEDWETGKERLNRVKEEWKNVEGIFEIILEHYDLDSINISLAKIEKYLEVQDKSLTVGEVTHLKFVIDLIKKKETFTLSNLL